MSEDTIVTESSPEESDLASRLATAKQRWPKRRIYTADSPAGMLILGSPRAIDYMAYRTLLFSDDPAEKAKAPNTLLLACAVDPDAAAMKAVLEDYVAIAGEPKVNAAIQLCIGTAKADAAKK